MGERDASAGAGVDGAIIGRARVTVGRSGLVIEAPGPRRGSVPLPAVLFGVPWFAAVTTLGVWYLGWGEVPESFWMRLLLWVVAVALTHNLSTLAYITIWNALYERMGTETLTIDPERIVVLRTVGRFKREHRIGRKIIEVAEVLGPDDRRPGRPRIEIKSWRAALGFGAGLDEREAEQCARVIQDLFDRDEAARHAAEAARDALQTARGRVSAEEDAARELSVDEGDGSAPEDARGSIMQAYREALDNSKGPLRSGLGALAAAVKLGERSSRRGR